MSQRTRRSNQYEDTDYLRTEQYHDATNLSARENLHRRFSTNRTDWFRWIFDHLTLPMDARILELGCGTGSFWLQNQDRLPEGWRVILSDFSPGMLATTRARLDSLPLSPSYCVVNAQTIPFGDGAFDAVIANHMLFHVPDRPRAFREIRRVLRSDGQLVGTTVGEQHMREMHDLIAGIAPHAKEIRPAVGFTLENGAAQLARWFGKVVRVEFPDELAITDAETLIAYVLSTSAGAHLDEGRVRQMRQIITDEITRAGAFRVTKSVGLFQCSLV